MATRNGILFPSRLSSIDEVTSTLFPGTDFEIPVTFDGWRFATKNADSKTHYSIRRTIDQNKQLGVIAEIQNDQRLYPEQYKNREIWAKIIASRDINSDDMLLRSEGERITNGTDGSKHSTHVLTGDQKPAVYSGKTPPAQTTLRVTIPLKEIQDTEFIKERNGNLQTLVGEAVYMPDFYTERAISLFDDLQTSMISLLFCC